MAERHDTAALASLSRLVLNFRLFAVLLTLVWLPESETDLSWLIAALVVAAAASFVPLLHWERLAPVVLRHPGLLAADLLLGVALLSLTGPDSPFFFFTLATALLAGVLYQFVGAVLFSALLLAGYVGAAAVHDAAGTLLPSFHTRIGLPVLYPLSAAAGAAVRGLLLRQRAVEAALTERTHAAVAAGERARLAREMHDSLAKTVQGIALSAAGLAAWIEHAPERAAHEAKALARAAERAATEARELIGDLRADRLDGSLAQAVRRWVQEWSADTGVCATIDVEEVDPLALTARHELFCVLKEGLRNVHQHAGAQRVQVRLHGREGEVLLTVADDGVGFRVDGGLDDLARAGHYGILGMHERAARVGGRLELWSEPGCGATVRVRVPFEERVVDVREEELVR